MGSSARSPFTGVAGTEFRRFYIRDEKTSGTNGGSNTAGIWNTRDLNAIVDNQITGASLSANQFTLPAGTFTLTARCPAFRPSESRIRIQNITDVTTLGFGRNGFNSGDVLSHDVGITSLTFTLAAPKVLELQNITSNSPGTTFARGNSTASAGGLVEIYSEVVVVQEVAALSVTGLETSDLFHVQEEQPAATAAGTFTSGVWQTRLLNTVKTSLIGGASLAANAVSLPAGTYYFEARAPAFFVNNHKTRLRDTTNSNTLGVGDMYYATSADSASQASECSGRFVLSATANIELQHRCSATRASDGFGGFGAGSWGEVEVYSVLKIWKVA